MKALRVIISIMVFFVSCQVEHPTEQVNRPSKILFVFDASADRYQGWKDEIRVDDLNRVFLRRVMGEGGVQAFRSLHFQEQRYLEHLLEGFERLRDNYFRGGSTPSGIVYEITVWYPFLTKTVRADGVIFDYQTWRDPELAQVRSIVWAFSDVRTSLFGEKMKAMLAFDFSPAKSSYDLDEEVTLRYGVTNTRDADVTLWFANQQQLGMKLYRDGRLLMDIPRVFLPATSEWIIPARSTAQQVMPWNQILDDQYGFGDRKVKAGHYTVVQYLLDGNSPFMFSDLIITENGTPLQARVVHDFVWSSQPVTFIYDLSNRVRQEWIFRFRSEVKVGTRILNPGGEVVYSDTAASGPPSELRLTAYGDFSSQKVWDLLDNSGQPVPPGAYNVEMWLLDQLPDYRAVRLYRVFR